MGSAADIAELAAASESLSAVGAALPDGGEGAWYVGGAVRDLLLGLPVKDVDIAVTGDPRVAARAVHAQVGGDIFSLSDRFGTWRVNASEGFQIDITALRGATIEEDLGHRDFTVNAMALSANRHELIDLFGGIGDIDRRLLKLVAERAYEDDPLRPLRLPRLAATLDFTVDADTAEVTRRHAVRVTEPAAERVFAELRGLLASPGALRGIRLLDELGLMEIVLPELKRLQGMEQTVYHHKDVYEHTLEVLENVIAFEDAGYAVFTDHAPALRELMSEELADELTRAGALRWAALLHDIGKPDTLTRFDEDRIGFPGHDIRGAEIVREICRRLHTSERFSQYVAALTRHHMRLGFQIPKRPLSGREIYTYLRKSSPVEVEVGVLSVADRMATRGRKHEEAIPRHIDFAIDLTDLALDWRANPLQPLIRGDELAGALGIEPGPRLGELLAEIAQAQYAGEVATADEAIALARAAL
ncbi:MAG: HD domain-containing protein [Solirubrobacterales bacterium]